MNTKEILKSRKIISDNIGEIIKNQLKDKNQLNLFYNEDVLLKLTQKTKLSNIEMLERERNYLGVIFSIDYLADSIIFLDLLKIPRISNANLNSDNTISAIAVCISKKEVVSKTGRIYYVIEFGDSIRKIKIKLYDRNIYSKLNVKDTYIIKLSKKSYYKNEDFFILIKHMNLTKKKLNEIFINPIILTNEDLSIKKNKEKAREFIFYMNKLMTQKTDGNEIKGIFKIGDNISSTYKIKFNIEIYNNLKNNFNFNFKYQI